MADSHLSDIDQVTLQLVAERVRSLSTLTDQGLKDIQRQLDDVRGLPVRIATLEVTVSSNVKAIAEIKKDRGHGMEFRRAQLPIIALTFVLAAISLVTLITQFHH